MTNSPDDFDFDAGFDKLEDRNVCEIEEIDPSKPGWEIYLHFDEFNPEGVDAKCSDDLRTFQEFKNLRIANFVYKRETRTAMVLPLQGCMEDQFDPTHIEDMKKYRATAKAPLGSRRPKIAPEASVWLAIGEAAKKVLTDDKDNVITEIAEDKESISPKELEQKIRTFQFGCLIIILDSQKADITKILEKMVELTEFEKLDASIDAGTETCTIVISIREGLKYDKPMDEQKVSFLIGLNPEAS